jgi:hypothetical protein
MNLITELLAEPLWHMSRGSKELFHSGVLAWMADTYPEQMSQALSPWLTDAPGAACMPTLREKRHLDLIFRLADRQPLAVENKAFSTPDRQQLVDYAERALPVEGVSNRTMLLSLMDPGWVADAFETPPYMWLWVSYGALAARLSDAFHQSDGTYAYETVLRYIKLIQLLQAIVESVDLHDTNGPLVPPVESAPTLRDARLWELAAKVRVQRVKGWIRQALDNAGFADVEVSAGFSNGTPILEAFASTVEGDEFGWQFQTGQWRLALRVRKDHRGRGDDAYQRREQFARRNLDWFDFSSFSVLTGVGVKPPPKSHEARSDGFNKYDPDFIYRYRLLSEATGQQLVDLAVTYTIRAAEFANR